MELIQKWSEQIPKPEPPSTNTIYSCTFHPDGALLFVAISEILIVYDAETGQPVTRPNKTANAPINCVAFAKDGKTFATVSNDRSFIIWKFNLEAEKKLEPLFKLPQNDIVLTLSFNPLTHQLFGGGVANLSLYVPGKKEIPKEKYKEKIVCSAWSADGQTIAFGTVEGTVSFRYRNLDQKAEEKLNAPVWCMEWSPITSEHQNSDLLVGCWDQMFYYFNSEGEKREKISQKHIPFNPICINFHHSGEFFLVTGTDKKVSLFSRDLGFLAQVQTLNDWSWSSKFRPKSNEIAMTTNSGLIVVQKISKKSISSCYHDVYVRRDNFTDVVLENIVMNQKLRLKCKELVKKISIFKDKLAVLQEERLLIYMAAEQGFKYNPYRKISKKFQCQIMEILNSHVLFADSNRIFVYNFLGEMERQWILDAKVTFLKTIGGPPKREHAIVGLANGQVLKMFVDNSFPIPLYRSSSAIIKCDLNVTKKKLAVLDLNKNLVGYDLISQAQLFEEVNVNSFCWNSDLEDSIAFSSQGTISIKTANLAPLTQKSEAQIIGFEGFQLFVIKNESISVMDMSQSSTLAKFVEKKEFELAYKLACLGVPENDLRFLGIEALQYQNFAIAYRCFVKLKDLPFIELTQLYIDQQKKGRRISQDVLKADLLAYQGKYQEAASLYLKANRIDAVIQLFTDLKKFDEAERYVTMSGNNDQKGLIHNLCLEQASWAMANGDWKQSGQLYIRCKEHKKAIQIFTKQKHLEGLIQICRIMEKAGNEDTLLSCATIFKKNKKHSYAKEIYLKLGDSKSLMELHVQMEKWDDAFLLGKQNKQLLELAKLPYANYLLKNDKYQEALRGFKRINRPDLTQKIINNLCKNAIDEKRFIDASRQYSSLATQEIKGIGNLSSLSAEENAKLIRYHQLKQTAQMYYVYNAIVQFVETPFFTSSDSALYTILNACRFLITKLNQLKLPYINASYIYYSLAKVSFRLEGYKTARACYDKLSQLVVQPKWSEQMELGNLSARSKPFSDQDSISPICVRCSMTNPIISDSNACSNCKHPFIISFMSFQVLPLLEFVLDKGVSHSKLIQLLAAEKAPNKPSKRSSKKSDGWNQSLAANQQVLSFNGENGGTVISNLVKDKVSETLENQQVQVEYIPVVLGEREIAELEPQSVYFLDQRKVHPGLGIKYYLNLSDILLKCCSQCAKFFLLDQYQFQFIQNKRCPYCNGQEKRSGRTKDIFDL